MNNASDSVDSAIDEVKKARSFLNKKKTKQVRSTDELNFIKAVAYSWKNTHRVEVHSCGLSLDTTAVDNVYNDILISTGKHSTRSNYLLLFKQAQAELIALRSNIFSMPSQSISGSTETAPNFSSLASDRIMQDILSRRWQECQKCMVAEAYLASTVMMGGLLEALFVAKANKLTDKSALFKVSSTPTDKTGKPIPLKEWTLNSYINVGHDLKWITKSAKDVAGVLRDYRNYVHPEKERTNGVVLSQSDASMFWEVTKQLTKQLLDSK